MKFLDTSEQGRGLDMRNKELDIVRGLAIGFVIVAHCNEILVRLPSELRQLWAGVDMFFVLSGFLICRLLLRDLKSVDTLDLPLVERLKASQAMLKRFYLRRFWRVVPNTVVWLMLPLLAALIYNSGGSFGKPRILFHEAVAVLTLQYNYAIAYGNGGYLAHFWSLMVEEHFYLVFPLLLVALRTQERRLTFIAAAIAFVVLVVRPFDVFSNPAIDFQWSYAHYTTHRRIDALLAGTMLAMLSDLGIGQIEGAKHAT